MSRFWELKPMHTTVPLDRLHVDFDVTDPDVLGRIASTAPHITKLKLVQSAHSSTDLGAQYTPPWRNVQQWRRRLGLFPRLDVFLMKINGPLTLPADNDVALVSQWLPAPQNTRSELTHVVVWSDSIDGTQRTSAEFPDPEKPGKRHT
ncbi:hypothetical protein DENSPDRAFT_934389 [Dentipellis sp. KUC8613]|nr:hypothetical protein DENSPDRAFT_934389 [Dentipellis sp. KUC8613]